MEFYIRYDLSITKKKKKKFFLLKVQLYSFSFKSINLTFILFNRIKINKPSSIAFNNTNTIIQSHYSEPIGILNIGTTRQQPNFKYLYKVMSILCFCTVSMLFASLCSACLTGFHCIDKIITVKHTSRGICLSVWNNAKHVTSRKKKRDTNIDST